MPDYDYSSNGYYFITICVKDNKCIFWDKKQNENMYIVGANSVRPNQHNVKNVLHLSHIGKIVDDKINQINNIYKYIFVEQYVIMPNHIHLIIVISNCNGRTMFAPTNKVVEKPVTISRVIKHLKGAVTKEIGFSIWQKSYYDIVIRNSEILKKIRNYIQTNPLKWELDKYYTGQEEIKMNIITGNVVSPMGFKAWGDAVGLKKSKKDMAIIVSEVPCNAAGCFTTNVVKAAPVHWDMKTVENEIRGIVVNSGNANAETTADKLAQLIGAKAENVLVCSTGVIGVNLPMDTVLNGVDSVFQKITDSPEGGDNAAEAIMTTDTYAKKVAVEIEVGGKTVTIGGMAKGSGMINPNMATMLCFITTDCAISKEMLTKALKSSVTDTFNMISVDGDMSTNDTVLCIANGLAGNDEITAEGEDFNKFMEALLYINKKLAMACADDGEGATKLIEAKVTGAKDKENARKMALSVVSSSLLKAAIFGEDANWGRVLCAMGYSGAEFDPMGVTIKFRSENGEILLMDNGTPIVFDEDKAASILSAHTIYIDMILTEGEGEAVAWGCDLTYDYVKINGDYRS